MTVKVTIGNRVVQQIRSWLVSADLPDWPIQPLIIQISGQSQSELPRGPDSCLESPSNAGCLPTGHTDAVPAAWSQNASRHLAYWRTVPRRDGITSRERPAPLRKGGWNDALRTDDGYLSVGQRRSASRGGGAADDLIQEGRVDELAQHGSVSGSRRVQIRICLR